MNEQEKHKAALEFLMALADLIREVKTIPAGHLYAAVMGKMDAAAFDRALAVLVDAGLVQRQRSGLLVWKGPAPRRASQDGRGI